MSFHLGAQKMSTPVSLDPDFNKEILKYLDLSVPAVSVQEIRDALDQYIVLDIRERKEYQLSHLPEAIHFGYDKPDWEILDSISFDQPILVYCSIGYRSEKIGEQLLEKGYKQVHNLYGSIFEWVNNGYPICDKDSNPTKKVHGYNKEWSRWIKNPDYKVKY